VGPLRLLRALSRAIYAATIFPICGQRHCVVVHGPGDTNFATTRSSASSIEPTRYCRGPQRKSQEGGLCRQKRASRQNSRVAVLAARSSDRRVEPLEPLHPLSRLIALALELVMPMPQTGTELATSSQRSVISGAIAKQACAEQRIPSIGRACTGCIYC
jgi:hypothetical protein